MHHSQQIALRHSLFSGGGGRSAAAAGAFAEQTMLLPQKRPHGADTTASGMGNNLCRDGSGERDHGNRRDAGSAGGALPAVDDASSPFLILRVRRSHLVEDSLGALASATPSGLLKPLRVVFEVG